MSSTRFGRNLKWIVRPEHRTPIRRMFTEVFGASTKNPKPHIEVYTLAGGENVGVFVDDDALTPDQQKKGPWLEFLVADVDATVKALEASGVPQMPYDGDKDHAFFQAPGGPVFRLAKG